MGVLKLAVHMFTCFGVSMFSSCAVKSCAMPADSREFRIERRHSHRAILNLEQVAPLVAGGGGSTA